MPIAEDILSRIVGTKILGQTRFPGGDISGAGEVRLADGRVVVAKQGPRVAVEARMLLAMKASGAPVPAVIGQEGTVLAIERLPDGGALTGATWSALAKILHQLHSMRDTAFGWPEDYGLRHVKVENAPDTQWPRFWSERRLRCPVPHLPKALGRRVETLALRVPELLPSCPTPSLLHGDLWGGNFLVGPNGSITGLIDPSAYYGDREVDAASLTVFDSPPEQFFDALELPAGWRARQPIYRLWVWLAHVRLFGETYRAAAERELETLGF